MKKVAEQEEAEQQKASQPTKLTMSIELANEVLQYLGSRPYLEVAELVKKIQNSELS